MFSGNSVKFFKDDLDFQNIYGFRDPIEAMQFVLTTMRDYRPKSGEIQGGFIILRYEVYKKPDLIVKLGRFDHHIYAAYPDKTLGPPEPRKTNYIPIQFQLNAEFFRIDALRKKLESESVHPDAKDSRVLTNLGWVETMGITDEKGNNIAWIPDFIGDGGGGYHIIDGHKNDFLEDYKPNHILDTEKKILEFILKTIRDNDPDPVPVPAAPGRIGRRYEIPGGPDLIVIYGIDDHHIHTAYPDT